MVNKLVKTLYVGEDNKYYELLRNNLRNSIEISHFINDSISFLELPMKNYEVILVDGEYKNPLTIIETIRNSYTDNYEPYIVLLITPDKFKDIKKMFSVRNYPDELSYKSTNTTHLKNQILFSFNCKGEFKEKVKKEQSIISGSLNKDPYGKILFYLFRGNFRGKLIVESSIDKGIFSFYDGLPFDIKFNRLQCTLGRMLLRRGIISEEDYLKSLELMLQKKIRHGEALIELGVIKPSELIDFIELQRREKLLFFFSRDNGSYKIIKEDVQPDLILPKVDMFSLIYDGIKQYVPVKYLEEKFLPVKNNFIALTENFPVYKDNFPFDHVEKQFIEMLNENLQLVQVLEKTELSLIDSLRIMEILSLCGMVKFVNDPETAKNLSAAANPKIIQLKEAILSDYAKLENKNYYEILEVSRKATADEIKKAYLRLVKSYHPDKFEHLPLGKDIMQKVSHIFQKIQIAYDTLSDPSARASYDEALSAPDLKEMIDKTEAIVNAEIAFKKGEILLKKRKYNEAEKFFREAVLLNDKEPEYLLSLAISLLFQKKANYDEYDIESRKLLEKVIYMNPYFDKGYYYLGIHNKLRGENKEAILCFKKALSINPDNKEAMMELKSLEKF
ncbi:MAG: DnaJ domain-containing protein [Proteobacteria bacterium]|nr:DnaJ domain-containing protein [Pseudomonadota bacterium]